MHRLICKYKKFEKTIFDGDDGEKAWSSTNHSMPAGAIFNKPLTSLVNFPAILRHSFFLVLLYFGILVMRLVNLIVQFGKHHAKKKHLACTSTSFSLVKHWTVNSTGFDIKFRILLDIFKFWSIARSEIPPSLGVLKTVSLFLLLSVLGRVHFAYTHHQQGWHSAYTQNEHWARLVGWPALEWDIH